MKCSSCGHPKLTHASAACSMCSCPKFKEPDMPSPDLFKLPKKDADGDYDGDEDDDDDS